ncbi:hypothetical protein LTR95_010835 [Oleoguttula sp. CCFEE 5521]
MATVDSPGNLKDAPAPPSANHALFPPRPPQPDESQIAAAMDALMVVQERATAMGKRPFTALLLAPDNTTVLLTHQSIDHVNHAESSLARLASSHYPEPYLWQCTLFSTWEPCAMCVATCYWANIGRIVYAASEVDLAKLTGEGNEENMTMAMPCRDVLKGSQKDVQILGPLEDWSAVVIKQSDEYWRPVRER